MRYMLLIYSDRRPFFEMSDEERAANMQEWTDYSAWLAAREWMQGGDALADVDHATSVRLAEGERIVTDGPFAETKETLGGYYLIDVEHLDDAIEAAARGPGARYGTIEVRPLLEMPAG
jgi:hypothetical protein